MPSPGVTTPRNRTLESTRRGASLAWVSVPPNVCGNLGLDVACESEEMDLKGKTGPVRSPAGGRTILRPDGDGYTTLHQNSASQMPRTGTGGRGVTMLSFKTFSFRWARNGPHLHPVIRTGRAPSDTPPWFFALIGEENRTVALASYMKKRLTIHALTMQLKIISTIPPRVYSNIRSPGFIFFSCRSRCVPVSQEEMGHHPGDHPALSQKHRENGKAKQQSPQKDDAEHGEEPRASPSSPLPVLLRIPAGLWFVLRSIHVCLPGRGSCRAFIPLSVPDAPRLTSFSHFLAFGQIQSLA